MGYKVLIFVVLSNLLSVAYAIDNPTVTHPTLPFNVIEPTTNATSPLDDMSYGSLTSTDPYQHCFTNSTWIVPPQTLLAYTYNSSSFTPVVDQTVWVIPKYDHGYFFGQSYAAINNQNSAIRYLIGSITPDGKVYITFSGDAEHTDADLVTGIGVMNVKSSGQCSFTMQMNSGQNSIGGLTHWSYMIPVKPGDFFYEHLPSTQKSVPEFLAGFGTNISSDNRTLG